MKALLVTGDTQHPAALASRLRELAEPVTLEWTSGVATAFERLAGQDAVVVDLVKPPSGTDPTMVELVRKRAPELPLIAIVDSAAKGAAAVTSGADGFVRPDMRLADALGHLLHSARDRRRSAASSALRVLYLSHGEPMRDASLASRLTLVAATPGVGDSGLPQPYHTGALPFDAVVVDLSSGAVDLLGGVQDAVSRADGRPVFVLTDAGDRTLGTIALRMGAQQVIAKSGAWPLRLWAALEQGAAAVRLAAEVRAVKNSEARLRLLVESLPVSIAVMTREGAILALNAAGLEALDISSLDAVVRTNLKDHVIESDRLAVDAFLAEVADGARTRLRMTWRSGDVTKTLDVVGAPLARTTNGGRVVLASFTVAPSIDVAVPAAVPVASFEPAAAVTPLPDTAGDTPPPALPEQEALRAHLEAQLADIEAERAGAAARATAAAAAEEAAELARLRSEADHGRVAVQRLSEVERELDALKSRASASDEARRALENEFRTQALRDRDDLERARGDLQRAEENHKSVAEQFVRELEAAHDALAQAEQARTRTEQRVEELEQQLQQERASSDEHVSRIASLTQELESERQVLAGERDTIASLRAEIETLARSVEDARREIEQRMQREHDLEALERQRGEELERASRELDQLQAALQHAETNTRDLSQLRALADQHRVAHERLGSLSEELDSWRERATAADAARQHADEHRHALANQHALELQEIEEAKQRLEQQLHATSRESYEREARIEELTTQLESERRTLDMERSTVAWLHGEVEQLRSEAQNARHDVEQRERDVRTLQEALAQAVRETEAQRDIVHGLEVAGGAAAEAHTRDIERLQADLREERQAGERFAQLEGEVEALQRRIQTLEQERADVEAQFRIQAARDRADIEAGRQALRDLQESGTSGAVDQERVHRLEADLASLTTTLTAERDLVASLKAEAQRLHQALDDVRSLHEHQTTNRQQEVTTLCSALDAAEQARAALVAEHQSQLDAIRGATGERDAAQHLRIASLEAEIGALRQRLSQLDVARERHPADQEIQTLRDALAKAQALATERATSIEQLERLLDARNQQAARQPRPSLELPTQGGALDRDGALAKLTSQLLAVQRQLSDAELRDRRWFENDLVAVAISTADGRLVRANATFTRLFGEAGGDVLRRLPEQWIRATTSLDTLAPLATEGRLPLAEGTVTLPDGRTVWYVESAAVVSDRAEHPLIERMFVDMTARYQVELLERERRGVEAVGRVAFDFVREIDSHVREVQRFIGHALEHRVDGPDPRADDLQGGMARVTRAQEVTQQFLAFSRGRLRMPDWLPLAETLDSLRPLLEHMTGEGIEFSLGAIPPRLHVRAPREALVRTLLSLVADAMGALPLGGHVDIVVGPVSAGASALDPATTRIDVRIGGFGQQALQEPGALDTTLTNVGGNLETVRDEATQAYALTLRAIDHTGVRQAVVAPRMPKSDSTTS